MAKKCDLCGRSATKGASRSHSKIKTLKRQNINLQTKTVEGLNLLICTACLRTLDKPKRVKTPRKPKLKEGELKAPLAKRVGSKSTPRRLS
ncbi:MAG: 50S ribosomal protein L28 [Patescibacteria group bacterium]|jgi:ribosomal protein L28